MISALQPPGTFPGSSFPSPAAGQARSAQRRSLRLELARRIVLRGTAEPRALRALEYLLVELFSQTGREGRYRVLLPEEQVDQLITWLLQDASVAGPASEIKEYLALMEETLRQPDLEQLVSARLLERIRQVKYTLGPGYFSRGAFKAAVQSLILLERVIAEPGFAPLVAYSGEGLLRLPVEPRVAPVMQREPRRVRRIEADLRSGVLVSTGLVLPPNMEASSAASSKGERSVIVLPPPPGVRPTLAELMTPSPPKGGEALFPTPPSSGLVLPPIPRAPSGRRDAGQTSPSCSVPLRAAAHHTGSSTSSRAPGTRPPTPGTWAKARAEEQALALPPVSGAFSSPSTINTVSGEWKHTLPPRTQWAGGLVAAAEVPEPEGLRLPPIPKSRSASTSAPNTRAEGAHSVEASAPVAAGHRLPANPQAAASSPAGANPKEPRAARAGKSAGPSERERRRLLTNVLEDLELVLSDPEALSEDTLTGKNLRAVETLNKKLEEAHQTGSRSQPGGHPSTAAAAAGAVPGSAASAFACSSAVRSTGKQPGVQAGVGPDENPFSLIEPSQAHALEAWLLNQALGPQGECVAALETSLLSLPPEVPDPARGLTGQELMLEALPPSLKRGLDIPLETDFVRRFDTHDGPAQILSLEQGPLVPVVPVVQASSEQASSPRTPASAEQTTTRPITSGKAGESLELDWPSTLLSDEERNQLWRMSVPELELEDPRTTDARNAQLAQSKKRAAQIRGKLLGSLPSSTHEAKETGQGESTSDRTGTPQQTEQRPSGPESTPSAAQQKVAFAGTRPSAGAPWDDHESSSSQTTFQGRLVQLKHASKGLLARLSQPVKVGKGSLTVPLPQKTERMMPTLRSLKTGSSLTSKGAPGEAAQQWARGRGASASSGRTAETGRSSERGSEKGALRPAAASSQAEANRTAGSAASVRGAVPASAPKATMVERSARGEAHAATPARAMPAELAQWVPTLKTKRWLNGLTLLALAITLWVGSELVLEPSRTFEFPSSTYQAYQIDAMAGKLPLASARRYGSMLLLTASPAWLESTPEQHSSMVSHLITHTFGRDGVERVVILDPTGRILADVDRDDLKISVGQR